MEIKFNNLDETRQEMTISIPKSIVEPELNDAYREIIPKINMPGFRKGKVPMHLIKKMHGKEIESEVQYKLADKYIKETLEKSDIFITSQIELRDIRNVDNGIDVVITYDYIPEFELQDYKNIVVDEPVHRVTDEEVEEYFEELRYAHGIKENAEVVEDFNYLVTTKINNEKEIIENHDLKEAELGASTFYLRNDRLYEDFKKLFLGKKVGDILIWKPERNDIENFIDDEFHYEITEIKKIIPIDITDEKVKEISKDRYDNLEDYKTFIGLDFQEKWDKISAERLEDNLVRKLVSIHDVKVPKNYIIERAEAFLKDRSRNKNLKLIDLPDFEIDRLLEQIEHGIKFNFITNKISKVENITVEDEDIDKILDTILGASKNEKSEENVAYFKEMIKENNNFTDKIKGDKIMEILKDFMETNEVAIEDIKSVYSINYLADGDVDEDEEWDDEEEDWDDDDEDWDEDDEEFFDDDDEDWDDDEEWDEDEDDVEWEEVEDIDEEDLLDDEEEEDDFDDDASEKKA